jgi:hypothetical protein
MGGCLIVYIGGKIFLEAGISMWIGSVLFSLSMRDVVVAIVVGLRR